VLLDLRILGAALLSTTLAALALVVLLHNRRAPTNRLFALAVFSIVGWIVSISIALRLEDLELAVSIGHFAFAFAAAMPFTLLCVFHAFPVPQATYGRNLVVAPGLFCAFFAVISFTPLIVRGAQRTDGRLNFIYGPLHPIFSLYVVLCFSLALYILWRKTQLAVGLRKLQLRYLLLGILLGGAGVISTNLIVPLIWRTSRYSTLGPYFSLLMVSFSAHAIIRHRLMDIRVAVRRGVVYLTAAGVAGAVFLSIIWLAARLAGPVQDVSLSFQVGVALAIALAFHPLKSWIQNRLDQYVYRESYDYHRTIRQASEKISSTLDRDSLLAYFIDVVTRALRPDLVLVFMLDVQTRDYKLVAARQDVSSDQNVLPEPVPSTTPISTYLARSGQPLVKDEPGKDGNPPVVDAARLQLEALRGAVAVPMLSEHRLKGFVVLGPKLSGDAFFSDDLELLTTLSHQVATALSNADLYGQVLLANEYVENILRTMDSGVITVNASGHVAVANSTAARLTDIPRTALNTSILDQLPAPLATHLRSTMADGQPRFQVEAALHSPGRAPTPIVFSTAALRDRHGMISGALVVFSDLSKLKALESEKRRAERLASFGTLVSGIAHEIKNPLVAIKTFAELLPERFTDSDFREDFAKVVVTEIDRIDDLVARLRGLAAPTPMPAGPIDIRESVSDTLSLLRAQLEHTRTAIRRDFQDAAPYVAVDPAQLKQLFLNLILNAVEAMGAGGDLVIRILRRENPNGSWIAVEVSDTGPGIPENIRAHVFDPFFTTKARGSGLGLSICRGITDAHRGTIRVENNQSGQGATIVVEFPSAPSSARAVAESMAQHG